MSMSFFKKILKKKLTIAFNSRNSIVCFKQGMNLDDIVDGLEVKEVKENKTAVECKEHDKEYSHICMTCYLLICPKCHASHKNHVIKTFAEYSEGVSPNLKELVKDIGRKDIKELYEPCKNKLYLLKQMKRKTLDKAESYEYKTTGKNDFRKKDEEVVQKCMALLKELAKKYSENEDKFHEYLRETKHSLKQLYSNNISDACKEYLTKMVNTLKRTKTITPIARASRMRAFGIGKSYDFGYKINFKREIWDASRNLTENILQNESLSSENLVLKQKYRIIKFLINTKNIPDNNLQEFYKLFLFPELSKKFTLPPQPKYDLPMSYTAFEGAETVPIIQKAFNSKATVFKGTEIKQGKLIPINIPSLKSDIINITVNEDGIMILWNSLSRGIIMNLFNFESNEFVIARGFFIGCYKSYFLMLYRGELHFYTFNPSAKDDPSQILSFSHKIDLGMNGYFWYDRPNHCIYYDHIDEKNYMELGEKTFVYNLDTSENKEVKINSYYGSIDTLGIFVPKALELNTTIGSGTIILSESDPSSKPYILLKKTQSEYKGKSFKLGPKFPPDKMKLCRVYKDVFIMTGKDKKIGIIKIIVP